MFTAIIGTECSSESQVSTPDGLCTAFTVIAFAAAGMATLMRSARRMGRIFMVVASRPGLHAAGDGFFLQEMSLSDAPDIGGLHGPDAVRPIFDVGERQADRERGAVVLRHLHLIVLLVGVLRDETRLRALEFAGFRWRRRHAADDLIHRRFERVEGDA